MLIRFEPFREFDRFSEELLSQSRGRQIPVDAYRRGNEFKVHLDLPGVDSRFIELTVEQDLLTVRATRAGSAEGDQMQIAELPGELSVSCSSARAWTATITANYENGVLTLYHPRSRGGQPCKVEITHAEAWLKPSRHHPSP
jgi:HSP20 family protein